MAASSQIQTKYVDRPEVSETFCDVLESFTFDGDTGRFVFCIKRIDVPKSLPQNKQPPTGCHYTACRLVLTRDVVMELHQQLNSLVESIRQDMAQQQPPYKTTQHVTKPST